MASRASLSLLLFGSGLLGAWGLSHLFVGDTLDMDGQLGADWSLEQEPQPVDGPGPDILITSTGGMGTSTFMAEMLRINPPLRLNHKDDADGLKHMPFQRLMQDNRTSAKMRDVKKIVYLHGALVRSVLSLDRRGYLPLQARKVRSAPLPSDARGSLYYPSLLEYAFGSNDHMQLEEHFISFWSQCQYPVAFVDVTRKAEDVGRLAQFLNVDAEELRNKLHMWDAELLSDNEKVALHYGVPRIVVDALERKFQNLTSKLSRLGALYIRRNEKGRGCAERPGSQAPGAVEPPLYRGAQS